jgi:superfamily I DNA/RNA helicase
MSDLMKLSDRQREIVELPLAPLSVTACAGSGKTKTAVHRVAHIRKRLVDPHGLVALLSFSNVAVDTFRRDYSALVRSGKTSGGLDRVEIDTVDGFITTNILRPHAHHVMKCKRAPYLVTGTEPFTRAITVSDGQRPYPVTELNAKVVDGEMRFGLGRQFQRIGDQDGANALARLGRTGAYTHNHGRYWAILTLIDDELPVLRALVRRYPQILIDEAQDIGPEQQCILELLKEAGSTISLIGDANQAIFEFAQADGSFLRDYSGQAGVQHKDLDQNFRSVPALVKVANEITGRADGWDREEPDCVNGAYYIPYRNTEKGKALDTFRQILTAAETDARDAVVLCRGAEAVAAWSGEGDEQGQGVVAHFVDAVLARESGRLDAAYNCLCTAVVGLLANKHGDLKVQLTAVGRIELRRLRQVLWTFMRDQAIGLPSGTLAASTDWHAQLVPRVKGLVEKICKDFDLEATDNIGRKLAKTRLEERPLVAVRDLAQADATPIRVSTVHKVKGESIGGVMYVVTRAHLTELLDGPNSEVGRIGYVALTRARDLFVLAVPENCLKDFEEVLDAKGFRRPGDGEAVAKAQVATAKSVFD